MVQNIDLNLLKGRLEKLNKHNINKIFGIIYNNEDKKTTIQQMMEYLYC